VSIFRVLGIVNAIGPCTVAEAVTAFAWIEFIERGGSVRRIDNLATAAEIARLIEPDAIGAWYVQEIGGSHRMLAVERADGPRAVDRAAMDACLADELAGLRAGRNGVAGH
jgi:hypothetical protein